MLQRNVLLEKLNVSVTLVLGMKLTMVTAVGSFSEFFILS